MTVLNVIYMNEIGKRESQCKSYNYLNIIVVKFLYKSVALVSDIILLSFPFYTYIFFTPELYVYYQIKCENDINTILFPNYKRFKALLKVIHPQEPRAIGIRPRASYVWGAISP